MKIFTVATFVITLPIVVMGGDTLRHTQGVFADDCSVNQVNACCCGPYGDKYCINEDNKKKCKPANYVFCHKGEFNATNPIWCEPGITPVYNNIGTQCAGCPPK